MPPSNTVTHLSLHHCIICCQKCAGPEKECGWEWGRWQGVLQSPHLTLALQNTIFNFALEVSLCRWLVDVTEIQYCSFTIYTIKFKQTMISIKDLKFHIKLRGFKVALPLKQWEIRRKQKRAGNKQRNEEVEQGERNRRHKIGGGDLIELLIWLGKERWTDRVMFRWETEGCLRAKKSDEWTADGQIKRAGGGDGRAGSFPFAAVMS